jgi:outer membrane protein assembly factor BamE
VYHPRLFALDAYTMHRFLRHALLGTAVVLATGCGVIYKVDINQGNLLDERTVKQLEIGMTKRQVQVLLGTPSIQSPFHQSRWDYTASISRRGGQPEVRTLTLRFDGDRLASIEGDFLAGREEQLLEDAQRIRGAPEDPLEERAIRAREQRDRGD